MTSRSRHSSSSSCSSSDCSASSCTSYSSGTSASDYCSTCSRTPSPVYRHRRSSGTSLLDLLHQSPDRQQSPSTEVTDKTTSKVDPVASTSSAPILAEDKSEAVTTSVTTQPTPPRPPPSKKAKTVKLLID